MNARIQKEIKKISLKPPFGISCHFKDDSTNHLEACISGIPDTPYEKGVFKLQLVITNKYPFEPPQIKFITPIYHPNIDNAGRICMDLLKMPPNGAWKPLITIEGLLTAIQSLLGNPNPDDPLVPDIADEFKCNKAVFEAKARKFTEEHAMQNKSESTITDITNNQEESSHSASRNSHSKRKASSVFEDDTAKKK